MISPSTQQIPGGFFQEATALLQQISEKLPELRQTFSLPTAHFLMRLAHTLKGAAAIVELDAIASTAQTLEYTFKALCAPEARLTPAVESLILETYDCLQQLLSTQGEEAKILQRMTEVVAHLEKILGHRFGQDSALPTSAQLGVDVTQSIFEQGVTEYLAELSRALKTADAEVITELLKTQADVFIGLAESLILPGFGAIAKTTLAALQQYPDRALHIAQLALRDYRLGQARVLQGDRTQGGAPSPDLRQLSRPALGQWLRQLFPWPLFPRSTQPADTSPLTNSIQPLSEIFQRCHRALQQLSQQHNKPVVVHLKPNDIYLDQAIAEPLSTLLLGLVRRAFLKGIEPSQVRQQQGKSAVGTIQLAAKQKRQHLILCVWDNGCGANPDSVCQQLRPHLANLQGTITAAHRPHQGTCFTLRIPIGHGPLDSEAPVSPADV